jgi:hypothetical protein
MLLATLSPKTLRRIIAGGKAASMEKELLKRKQFASGVARLVFGKFWGGVL